MEELTRARLLAKNSLFNLFGQVAPVLVAVATIPILVHNLGTERFGLLTLIWLLVGYFSLFDFGLGRALTQLVSEHIGTSSNDDASAVVWTALTIMGLMGCAGAIVLALLAPWLIGDLLNVSPGFSAEARQSLLIIALCVPVVIVTTGLRGFLEAWQRFDLINIIRVPLSIFTFLGPVLVLPLTQSLVAIVIILTVGRVVGLLVHFYFCYRIAPTFRHYTFSYPLVPRLLRFGGWLTVSNVVGSLMVYLDRFLIGAFIAVSVVAYYTTPYEVVSKMTLVSTALIGVLFPAFSSTYIADRDRTRVLFVRGLKYATIILFPIAFVFVLFAKEGITVWLGDDFSANSYRVMQILAIGMFINNLAIFPFILTQSAGRPDIAAKLHILELPFYFLILWLMASNYGIVGVAVAWGLRAAIDAVIFFAIGYKLLDIADDSYRNLLLFVLALHLVLFVSLLQLDVITKLLWAFLVGSGTLVVFLRFMLDQEERGTVVRFVRKVPALVRSRISGVAK